MAAFPKVAIIYLSFNPQAHLPQAVKSFLEISYPHDQLGIIAVDNLHPQTGSAVKILEHEFTALPGGNFREFTILPQEENLGFTGGMNAGIRHALTHGYDYIFLHNQDGYLHHSAIAKLVEAMEAEQNIGAAQALVVFADSPEQINSAGNAVHYLGFGFCNFFRSPVNTLPAAPIMTVTYASGAALMLRSALVKQYGALDEDFFAYHEDLEYSWRVKFLGYSTVLVRDALFYHRYEFKRNKDKFYLMERNRYAILFMFLRWRTILILLPMLVAGQMGLIVLSLTQGWWTQKARALRYWIQPRTIKHWHAKRQKIQASRKITDQQLAQQLSDHIIFEDSHANNWLVRRVANPLFRVYWKVAKRLIV